MACADQLLKQSSLLCLLFNAIRHKTGILSFFFYSFFACARNSRTVSQRRPIVYLLVTEASYCVFEKRAEQSFKAFLLPITAPKNIQKFSNFTTLGEKKRRSCLGGRRNRSSNGDNDRSSKSSSNSESKSKLGNVIQFAFLIGGRVRPGSQRLSRRV